MINLLRGWFRKYFSDPQAIILGVLLVVGFSLVLYLGEMLAPVLASAVVAYLLEEVVQLLGRLGVPRLPAVIVVFLLFLAALLLILFGLLPLLSRQLTQLFQDLPNMITRGQQLLLLLPEKYPELVSAAQVKAMMDAMRATLGELGQNVLSISLASLQGLITLLVYLILVPFLVFFFLKDKDLILSWIASFLPRERRLANRVWNEMNAQIGNYVRGKLSEIIIVGGVTYLAFAVMGLHYAPLLGFLVGLSVIVPYVGAAVVTIPVALIAYFQWGWTSDFFYVMGAYGVIQAVDGNVLVPVMFSEVVNLHPVAIIVAILFFGGVWGFWGVFFAIPLATLVQAVITAWPRSAAHWDSQPPGQQVSNTCDRATGQQGAPGFSSE